MSADTADIKPVKLGVVGLGRGFMLMLPTFLDDPRVELVGTATTSELKQQEFEKLFELIKNCPEQLAAWEKIQEAIAGGDQNVVFLDGPAGSGKTTPYKALLH